jgi:hypothetical protein
MKTYGGVDTKIHVFLTSAFCGAQWRDWRHFTFGDRVPGMHLIGVT